MNTKKRNCFIILFLFAMTGSGAEQANTPNSQQSISTFNQVTVSVTDKQGHVLSNVPVTELVTGQEFKTDENGQFKCDSSNIRRAFYAFDKKLKLAQYENLNPGQRQLRMQLAPAKTLSGRVVDSEGKPVSGVQIAALPMMPSYVFSDNEGLFEIGWLQDWAVDLVDYYLMARDLERNLAGGVEFTINTNSVEVKLEPALTLKGIVEDFNGVPIQNAKIGLGLRKFTWSCVTPLAPTPANMPKSDEQGSYEFHVLPQKQIYAINAQADGFGRSAFRVDTKEIHGELIKLEPLILKIANMSVSGTVIDIDGNPVSNAEVYCSGTDQPNRRVRSDSEGKFNLDKICAGEIRVYALKQQRTQLFGYTQTESGAKDLKIVVTEPGVSKKPSQAEPSSLMGKTLPDMKNMPADFTPELIKGKSVLVCFWDYNQRPSRNGVLELNGKAQELEAKGVTIITIHTSKIDSDTLNQWIKDNKFSLSIGKIETGEEQTKLNWGVKALPWLILTDKKHVVTAEGFSMNELDEKFKQIAGE